MDSKNHTTQELIINGELYAKYECDTLTNTVFLKVVKKLFPDEQKTEDLLIQLIGGIENRNFKYAAYLNVD